jgi:hypothetical protein
MTNGSNKMFREGLPSDKQPKRRFRPHRSPGWIKAREERSARRAADPAVQARARGQEAKAQELDKKKAKSKETQERIDQLIADQKAADKKTKWEKN